MQRDNKMYAPRIWQTRAHEEIMNDTFKIRGHGLAAYHLRVVLVRHLLHVLQHMHHIHGVGRELPGEYERKHDRKNGKILVRAGFAAT